jgi:uncharacterized protein YggE
MNERLDSIASALEAVGLPWDSIPTAGFSVRPEEDRNSPGRPIVGFTAATTLRTTLGDFSRIPIVIEEALGAGANTVTGVEFESTQMQAAREEALRQAVAQARRQAEVIAEGLGRELGAIIEVITPEASRIVGHSVSLAASRRREIVPQLITVSQTVSVRWRLRDRPR